MNAYRIFALAAIVFCGACCSATVQNETGGEGGGSSAGGDADGNGGGCPADRKACGAGCVPMAERSYGFWWDCNGNTADGCEVNAFDDSHNCGYCGNDCNAPHAAGACERGYCHPIVCEAGWFDCNGAFVDGCESAVACD